MSDQTDAEIPDKRARSGDNPDPEMERVVIKFSFSSLGDRGQETGQGGCLALAVY